MYRASPVTTANSRQAEYFQHYVTPHAQVMASNYDNSNGSITEANLRTVTRKKSQRITTLRQQGFAGRELDSEAHPGFDTEALSLPLQELQLEDDAGSSLEHLLLEIENKLGEAECDPRSLGASFRELHTRCRQLEDRVNRAEHDLKAKDLLYVGLQTRYDDLQNQTIRDEATWKHSQMTLRNEYNEFANKAKRDIAALKNSRATLQTDYNGLADEVRRDTEASKPSRKKLKTKYSELKTQTNSEINTLKVYLREYQTKWNQLTEQHETLERQCSALVEEISGLRSKNLVDDESILQDNFKSLYFSIRSWCMRLTDNKLDPREPIWLTNPLLDDGFLYSCTTEASELHFLIAGLWTWLIKLVFDRLTDMECDDPDLWTEQKSSEAMRVLERGLVRQGKIVRSHTGLLRTNALRCQKRAGMAHPDGPSTCTMSFKDGSPVHRTHHQEDHGLGNNWPCFQEGAELFHRTSRQALERSS